MIPMKMKLRLQAPKSKPPRQAGTHQHHAPRHQPTCKGTQSNKTGMQINNNNDNITF